MTRLLHSFLVDTKETSPLLMLELQGCRSPEYTRDPTQGLGIQFLGSVFVATAAVAAITEFLSTQAAAFQQLQSSSFQCFKHFKLRKALNEKIKLRKASSECSELV